MANLDTIDKIASQLLLHCPLAGKPLATVWASNSWEKLARGRDRWSWLCKFGQFQIPAAYSTGTIAVSSADPTLLTLTGGTFTAAMVGRSIRIGQYVAPYELSEFVDSTHMRITLPWGMADETAATFTIYQQYVTVPDDFAAFIAAIDPVRNTKLYCGAERREIDRRDPRRTTSGNPYVLAEAGYGAQYAGSVDVTPFQVRGTGTVPVFGGAYNGPVSTIYIVEITTGGDTGTAVFKWKRGSGSYTTGVVTDAAGNGLSGNVFVAFPTGTYNVGDVFVSRATAAASFGNARFELWPGQLTQLVVPYYYAALPPDLTLPGATLPRTIRGDVLLRGALAECKAWAGRGDERNALYDLKASVRDQTDFERAIDLLALRDDDLFPRDVTSYQELPFAGPPWDAAWEQVHA